MHRERMKIIDNAVVEYLKHYDKQYETIYLKAVMPIIRMKADTTCAGSIRWDADELYSILLEDAWRLFKIYTPKKGQKFHYLLLRQLNNKTINYINNTTGRIYQFCFVCGYRAKKKNNGVCTKCSTSLKKPNMYTQAYSEVPKGHSHTPDFLKEIENKELVQKVLTTVKDTNPKTYKILTMLMAGYGKSEISRELNNMAQNALNNRIRNCEKILDEVT